MVIDEAHAYRGAFGCHTALILRRLRRICSHGAIFSYGCKDRFPPFLTCQLSFNWTCNNYKNNTNKYLTTIMHPLISSAVYGSDPSFIFSTATSANPREHCMVRLETDRNFMVVSFCSLYCSIACKYFFYVLFLL